MQINRLFEIVYILLQKKTVTANELAERFGVSQRTIYRDIDILDLAGIPIYTETGRSGGISLLPDYVLNKSILTEQEQNQILSALHGISNIKTSETGMVLEKMSAIFNKPAINWLQVDFSGWGFVNIEYFNIFKTAIIERRIVDFDYYSIYGEQASRRLTRRRIEPMQLWFNSKAWYVKGFCLNRQEMRIFKLTRLKNLSITNENFPERDPAAIRSGTSLGERIQQGVTLKLRIDKVMSHRVYDEFGEEITEHRPDGSFIVTITWPEDEWVYGTILSWGEYMEVLEPQHIREIIKNKASKISNLYL